MHLKSLQPTRLISDSPVFWTSQMDVLLLLGRFHICRLLWKQINWTETAKNTRYATTEEYEEEYLIVVTVVLLGWFQVIISGKWQMSDPCRLGVCALFPVWDNHRESSKVYLCPLYSREFFFEQHIKSVIKSGFYHLKKIARVRPFLSQATAESEIMHSFLSGLIIVMLSFLSSKENHSCSAAAPKLRCPAADRDQKEGASCYELQISRFFRWLIQL